MLFPVALYAQVTKNSVLEAGDRKVSMRHPYMLPDVAVIDPELTLSMPKDVTAHTGLDALTQCIEPYVSNSSNPLTDAVSLAGIKVRIGGWGVWGEIGGGIKVRLGSCLFEDLRYLTN